MRRSEKIPMRSANIPNGSADPRSSTQVPAKNVQAKEITARKLDMMTEQSPLSWPYESMICYSISTQ